MLLLGIDIGTSSIKVSVVDADSRECICSAQYPDTETGVIAAQPGWAEQSPGMWWEHVRAAVLKLHAKNKYDSLDIGAIGIAYQMHGLVLVDKNQEVLRNSIIWCDSRAVEIGDRAFEKIGKEKCLTHLLNSPGNFTASKLAWVKEHEPQVYSKIDKIMLPGDFIAMKLTGTITTTIPALSEGMFWDFKQDKLFADLFEHFDFDTSIIPPIKKVFEEHGTLTSPVASILSLKPGIPVSYKAGDQPNNALSMNVFEPGEIAATAGTSGVIYGVTDQLHYDAQSRVNSFAHVNYDIAPNGKKLGILLCINGTGIMNRWIRNITGTGHDYGQMNDTAGLVEAGSEGLMVFPFGNGAERIFNNKMLTASINKMDLNKHGRSHIYRAVQEGICFAFRYGLDIMKQQGIHPTVIRAGKANMFLSDVFITSFVNTLNVPVELYHTEGSTGAAIGAGVGAGIFTDPKQAFINFKPDRIVEPTDRGLYESLYHSWLKELQKHLN